MTTKTGMRIARAFREGRARTIKNTQAFSSGSVWLYDKLIAYVDPDGVVCLSLTGHPTRTTRDRLNAILEAYGSENRFWQHRYTQYYGRACEGTANDRIEIGASEWVPMAGPLGMQALKASRTAAE